MASTKGKIAGGRASAILTEDDGAIVVVYHGTSVVTIYPSGAIRLNTGGWWTVTTKRRMNQAAMEFNLPYTVFQDDGRWYVHLVSHAAKFEDMIHGETIRMETDTFTISPEMRATVEAGKGE